MNWLAIGGRIAKAVILGANTVESAESTLKGDMKRELAIKFAADSMSLCSDALPMTDEVQKALKDYNDAYVKLQNVLAGK